MAGAVISARQLFAAAMAAEAAGDRAGAERGYRRVAMAAPDNPVSALRRGLAALTDRRPVEAAHLLHRVLIHSPDNWRARLARAEALAAYDSPRAARAMRAILAIAPAATDLWLHHGLLAWRADRASDSLRAATRAVTLAPAAPAAHARRGFYLRSRRRVDEAARALRRAMLLAPAEDAHVFNVAVTEPMLGAQARALRWLRAGTVLAPLAANTWTRFGRFLYRAGDNGAATGALRRALVLDPANPDAPLDLAACYRLARTPAEADPLRWTLAGHPATFDALVRLGQIEEARGRAAIAAALTLRALDMAPDLDSLAHRLRRLRADPAAAALIGGRDVTPHYQRWIAAHEGLSATARAARLNGLAHRPRISVILPVHDPAPDLLAAAIASVRDQSYPDWQLCICDDASSDPAVIALLDQAAASDPRIILTRRRDNGHISRASNDALATADGDYVTFLDHDDALAGDALLWVATAIDEHPGARLLYSDEDKIDERGERFAPHFKPDWSPELILGQNYVCHLAVYRRDLVAAVGGLRPGYEGSQDHDLVLRASAHLKPAEIHHIPRVLYHWRAAVGSTAFELTAKPYALLAGQRAVADHLAAHAPGAAVAVRHNRLRLTWPLPDPAPKVTVIVPTRDQAAMTEQCLDAVLHDTAYPDFEVILVDNDSREAASHALFARLAARPRLRLRHAPGPFNYSALNNDAARDAAGDILCFLNNDCEPLRPDWLAEMVALAVRPAVGAVGAMLLYPDQTVQHAGLHLIGGDVARHGLTGLGADEGGYMGRLYHIREVAAVTGACLVMRREVFDAVGGFDAARFPVDFSDVDLCLRVRATGRQVLWTPHALLTHHESASRGHFMSVAKQAAWEAARDAMRARHGPVLAADPFYNPNLAFGDADYQLAEPPRVDET